MKIGELFTLTVFVSGVAEGTEIVFPELPDTGSVTALGPPLISGDQPADSQSALYEMAAWQAGEMEIPPAELVVIRDGAELVIPLPGVTVRVTSVLPLEADPDTLAWSPRADMIDRRWYATNVTLPDNRVFTKRGSPVNFYPIPDFKRPFHVQCDP